MKRFLLFISVIALLQSKQAFAQDPHYSQYNEISSYINPALCGVAYDVRAMVNYRSQWGSVSTPYKTYGGSAEFAIKHVKTRKAYLTAGLIIYEDVAGSGNMSQLHVGGILGAVVNTGAHSKLSFAATGSFDQRRITGGNFQWENQYNGYQYDAAIQGETLPTNQINYSDFGAGVNFHFAKSEKFISSSDGHRFDMGFSVYHLNTPLISFYNTNESQYMKYINYMSFTIALPRVKANIIPSYILMFQGPSIELDAGIMFRYIISEAAARSNLTKSMAISAGVYYRSTDAIIPQVLLEFSKYAVGVSYDFNTSQLTPYSRLQGGLELMLRYNWNPGYGTSVGNTTGPKSTPYFK
ncbi:MAG TPA: PorP/SprF family type IX secretion system membrane protein [Bacteroidia bacterium]|nr:PorP/SprF family type IX secretion system membrane protein [Bacteroidia bacterium]